MSKKKIERRKFQFEFDILVLDQRFMNTMHVPNFRLNCTKNSLARQSAEREFTQANIGTLVITRELEKRGEEREDYRDEKQRRTDCQMFIDTLIVSSAIH